MRKRKSQRRFLVVAQTESDTIPIRLCSTHEDALEFITKADEKTIISTLRTIFPNTMRSPLGVVSMAVLSFRDGQPCGCDVVRYWEQEPVKVQLERVWKELGFRKQSTESVAAHGKDHGRWIGAQNCNTTPKRRGLGTSA